MPKKSKTSESLPSSSESFPFEELTAEIRDLVISMLPPEDLKNLRETSSANRDFVDRTLMTPSNLEIFLAKLTEKQRKKFMEIYEKLYGDEFRQQFQAMLNKNPMKLVNDIIGMDRQKAFEFTEKYPNVCADKVASNAASMEELLAYILTVDDFNKIKFKDIDELHRWSEELSSKQLKDTIHLMWFVVKCLQDPELQTQKEKLDLIFNEMSTGKYQGIFCNFKKLTFDLYEFPPQLQLANLDFSGVIFYGCKFNRTNLGSSKFIGALFDSAQFVETNFSYANLTNAKIADASIEDTDFSHANLTGANFNADYFCDDVFFEADLTGANFENVAFDGNIEFIRANLSYANLKRHELNCCDFTGANLSYVDLSSANFSYTTLAAASLYKAKLKNARIFDVEDIFLTPSFVDRLSILKDKLSDFYYDLQDKPDSFQEIQKIIAVQVKLAILEIAKYDKSEAKAWLQIAENHMLFKLSEPVDLSTSFAYTSATTQAQFKPGKTEAMKVFDDPALKEIAAYNVEMKHPR